MSQTAEAPVPARDVRRSILRVVLVLAPLVALFSWMGVNAFRGQPRDVGNPIPSFKLERLGGNGTLRSAELAGKPYVLNFWASWCVPCREEAPMLAEVAGRGLGTPRFLGVNVLDAREEALMFVRKFKIRYPNFRDGGRFLRRVRVAGIPETLFVSSDGRLVGRYVGAMGERTLRRLMKDLVGLKAGELLEISGSGKSVDVP